MAVRKKEETKTVKATTKAAVKPMAAKAGKSTAKKIEVIIQSPMGGNIMPEEILSKVGKAEKIYIRVDENKAYWVRGRETGSVDLWD